MGSRGERAEAFLYCVEVKPEGCDYYIPLAPSWVITEKYRMVASWQRVQGSDRLKPEVIEVSADELKKYKDKKFAAGCSRDIISQGAEKLGWTLDELLEKTILAMRECEDYIEDEIKK